jgi:hypothetical protein
MTGDPGDTTAPDPAPAQGPVAAAEADLTDLSAPPTPSDTYLDARGGNRWMRATWHPEADCFVLSVWRGDTCIATMRVARDDVPGLVQTLVGGLVVPPNQNR